MKNKITALLFLSSFVLFSQQTKIDSLKTVLQASTSKEKKLSVLDDLNGILIRQSSLKEAIPFFSDMAKLAKELNNYKPEVRAYNYTSEAYKNEMDSINSFAFARKAVALSQKNNNAEYYLSSINQLGRSYHHFQYYKKAIKTYNEGIENEKDNDDKDCLVFMGLIYSNLSASYDKLGERDKSINAILKGVEIAEKTNSVTDKSYAWYSLGYKYMDLKNYKKAEEYFLKSLKFSDSVSLKGYVNMNHHGLGINYSRWGKYDKALDHNQKALKFYKQKGNKLYEFDVLNNTATLYQRMNMPDSGAVYGKRALVIAKQINHKLAITGAKLTLSNSYLDLNQYRKAEKLLLEVAKDTINRKVLDLSSKASVYEGLSIAYEGQKKFKESLTFLKKFKTLNDSIEKDNLNSKFSEIETKYQTEKKENENLQLKADNAEQQLLTQKANTRNWLLGLGVLLLGGVASLTFRRYKKEAKAKQIITQQKSLVENLQKELHHRIKNNLAIINSFIDVTKEEFNQPQLENKLTELQNRIDSINQVHEQLYTNKDVTNLNLKSYIDVLANNVQHTFNNYNVTIEKNIANDITVHADKSFPIGLIINEFLTNSFKYAFTNNNGLIQILLNETKDAIELHLKDNGKGLPNDFNIKTTSSFGLRIIRLLTKQLNGTFDIKNNNGVQVNIMFPK